MRWALLLLVLTTACTSSGVDSSAPSTPTSTSNQPAPATSSGVLVLDVSRRCCYTEGSFFFLRVRTRAGELILERSYTANELEFVMRESLAPDRYSIVTYERPCEAVCPEPGHTSALDPPTNRCRISLTVKSGEKYRLRVTTGPGVECPQY